MTDSSLTFYNSPIFSQQNRRMRLCAVRRFFLLCENEAAENALLHGCFSTENKK